MPDEPKKIIVDTDWKEEAKREKERIAQEVEHHPEALPEPSFPEIIQIITMQALAGLGMLAGPGGQAIPPDPLAAKHYIDLLELLHSKTKGNLTADESKLLETVMYDLRMKFVQFMQMAAAAGVRFAGPGAAPGGAPSPGAAEPPGPKIIS